MQVAAGLVPVAIGTETNGSISAPATACGVVGIKPSVGLTSRVGVVPISRSQDSVGTFGVTVFDAASLLEIIVGYDERDVASSEWPDNLSTKYTEVFFRLSVFGSLFSVNLAAFLADLLSRILSLSVSVSQLVAQLCWQASSIFHSLSCSIWHSLGLSASQLIAQSFWFSETR